MSTAIIVLLVLIVVMLVFLTFIALVYIKLNYKIILANFAKISDQKKITQEERDFFIKSFADTLLHLSANKIGALIAHEQRNSLHVYNETGYQVNANFSKEFIISIFANKTASFHDGALIMEGTKISSISCYLPISKKNIHVNFGARHRAALGLSEITDAIVFIVSETNGRISFAQKGELNYLGKSRKEVEENIKRLL